MKTRVVYLDVNKITIDEMTLPPLKPNQVLIKAHQASICGSERYFYRGITVRPQDEARGGPETRLGGGEGGPAAHAYPMGPLGHEGGGTIVEMGSGVDEYLGGGQVRVGDRVGSLVYPTYTDYWVTDIGHVQPIPEGVSFDVGCLYEPLGCAAWAAMHMGVLLGDIVAVNGVGFAGNIMLQGALKAGASMVIAVDVQPDKLAVARELGATHTLNAREVDPVQAVLDLTHGQGVDVAVEAVGGTGIGIVQALGMVRHNGIMALYGDNYAPVQRVLLQPLPRGRAGGAQPQRRALYPAALGGEHARGLSRRAARRVQPGHHLPALGALPPGRAARGLSQRVRPAGAAELAQDGDSAVAVKCACGL